MQTRKTPTDDALEALRAAGEAAAADFDRAGLALHAATLRGVLVALAGETVERERFRAAGYSVAIVTVRALLDGRAPSFR